MTPWRTTSSVAGGRAPARGCASAASPRSPSGSSVRSAPRRTHSCGVIGEVADEHLDQVLGRLEPARDELEQHVEEDVVGELLLADLVLLREDPGDRVVLGVGPALRDQRHDDLPHLLAHAREAGRVGLGELSARLPRVRRNSRRSSISWLNRCVLLLRQADQAERDGGRERRRDRRRDLDHVRPLGRVDDVADDRADDLLAAPHRAGLKSGATMFRMKPWRGWSAGGSRSSAAAVPRGCRAGRSRSGRGRAGRGRRRRSGSGRRSGCARPSRRAPRPGGLR